MQTAIYAEMNRCEMAAARIRAYAAGDRKADSEIEQVFSRLDKLAARAD